MLLPTAVGVEVHNSGYRVLILVLVIMKQFKRFETILFPQDMILDIYNLHWNMIHKSTGVT